MRFENEPLNNSETDSRLPYFEMDFQKLKDVNGISVIPAFIVDALSKEPLMCGFMNEEAFEKSRELEEVVLWSRTRKDLWLKGKTSGNRLKIVSWFADCDNDTLLIFVNPQGPVCHREGKNTCFEKESDDT